MADQTQPAMISLNAQGQVAQPAQVQGPVALQAPAAQGGAQAPNQVLQGIPQVAAAAAGGLPAMPATVRHGTFGSLYNDPTCDPLWNSAATILQRFDPMRAEPLTGDALKESISGDPSRPSAFLCCTALYGGTHRVYIVHMLSRYPPGIDGNPSPWDNRICAYLGDVVQERATNVLLPENVFDALPPVLVYNEETLAQELPNLANGFFFPRGRHQNGNVSQVTVRPIAYLPTRYASMFLNSSGYTVQDVWARLLPQMQQDGLLADSGSVLAWLRATLHASPPNNTGPPATAIELTVPVPDINLCNHRSQTRVLTGLGTLNQGFQDTLSKMANALVAQTAEARTARITSEMERSQPTLPSSKFSMLFTSLKNMLNVETEEQLPEFWFTLAAAPKKQEFSTARDYLDKYSRTSEAFIAVAPIPTPKLLTDLAAVTFVADHEDDLKTGIQPFIVMDGSAAYRQATQELARTYTVLAERDVTLSYSDWDNFKIPKDLRSYPTSFYELEQSLGVFGNLIATVLGETHPITTSYRIFWSAFCRRFRSRIHREIDDRKVIKPVHVLRNIQLACFQWFNAKKDGTTPEAPNFLKILEKIGLSTYTLPTLPLPLYQLIQPKPPSIPSPTLPPSLAGTGSASSLDSISLAAQSIISALTNNSLPTRDRTGKTSLAVTNPTPDTTLSAVLPSNVRIKDLMGTDEAPRNEAGSPMCLSFHIRGACFSNCRRKADHERPLTPKDKQTLSNWVIDQLAKRRAAGAIP